MGLFKSKKSNKPTKSESRAAERSNVLFDDEFFDVDNGIERLEISELGIYESRSRASVEAKPTLQEKVRHASAVEDEPISVKHGEADRRDSDIFEPEFTDVGAGRNTAPPIYDFTVQDVPVSDTPASAASTASFTTDPGADQVFTSTFDPFEMIMSEELASKPSSRSLLDEKPAASPYGVTVNENISELTEQDIERAKKNAEFERRKAELLKKSRPEPEVAPTPVAEEIVEDSAKEEAEPAVAASAEDTAPQAVPTQSSEVADIRRGEYSFVPEYTVSPSGGAASAAPYSSPSSPYSRASADNYSSAQRNGDARGYASEYDSLYREQPSRRSPEGSRAAYRRAASFAAATVAIHNDTDRPSAPRGYERREDPSYGYTQPSYGNTRPYYPDERPAASAQGYSSPSYAAPTTEPAYTSPSYVAPATEPAYTSPSYATPTTEPAYTSPSYAAPATEPTYSSPSYAAPTTEPAYTSPSYTAPTTEPNGYSAEGHESEFTPFSAEPAAREPEYVEPSFKPYAPIDTEDEDESGLVFEFDTRKHISGKADEPVTLATERAMLFDSEDTEESAVVDAPDASDSGDGWEAEEIPPEEQNPEVVGMRDMFTAFRGKGEEAEGAGESDMQIEIHTAEDGYTPVMPEYNENDIIVDSRDAADTEDAPPFDEPTSVAVEQVKAAERAPEKPEKSDKPKKPNYKNYKKPPIELLGLDSKSDDDEITQEIQENTRIIIETLASFNVTASIKGVDRGPRITRYEVVPAKGVTVNAITHRFDDITLNLAADGIRMEAPIPGKSAIGFEIPNKNPANVRLRELLECDEFQNAKSNTFVCIGKDVAGNPVFGDIGKFPHALVAGATGMGKSVAINSIMISMLYKSRPDQVKFIMIDPKKVEFRMYSGIPHLLIPVITEAKQAAGALMWAVEEMERRYDLIEKLNIRNIEAYNERQAADPSLGEHMPKIIIVIDELNDLMMQVRDPVEDLIMRIAQKARAAGIHLIIGTQRPDVKVITGTIKANINTRLSCKVTSVVDSRTILEMAGAEKLLNRGDMLFKPVDKTKPIRVQGAFVSDSEVEAIMDFLKNQDVGGQYDDEIFAEINKAAQKCGNKKSGASGGDDDFGGGDDECGYYNDQKFLDAVELAIRSGKISTSLLQRKMSIGYGKAAKYIDAMEEIGVVGEPNGQKPRDVLLSLDEWYEKLSRVGND